MNNIDENLTMRLQGISDNFEHSIPLFSRKLTGTYYTPLNLTEMMMKEMISSLPDEFRKTLPTKKFLEPCVGTGNFVFGYLNQISTMSFNPDEVKQLLENIYVCDINKEALSTYIKSLTYFVKERFNIILDDEYFKKHVGSGLLFDVNSVCPEYISINKVFPDEVVKDGFDIVVTNPPYKNLKAESQQYDTNAEYETEKKRYGKISTSSKKQFKYSTDGVLNLYKLFVEEIIEKYTNKNAIVSLLIPATILSDKSCEKLRTRILEKHSILSVKIIRENNPFIDANQTLCAMLIHKNKTGSSILMTKDYCSHPTQKVSIAYNDIMNRNTGNSIFSLNNEEYALLKRLRKFPVIKDFNFIKNLRGELDLTAQKSSYSGIKTDNILLRGRNIEYYNIACEHPSEYVSSDFIEKCTKRQYIHNDRIACQQIVNIQKERRLTFSYVPAGYVLANSCNFIAVDQNEYGIDLYFLLGLLNSPILNWYFKLTSSNNHVNNYEIDALPIPYSSKSKQEISKLVKQYISNKDSEVLHEIDRLVAESYGEAYSVNKNITLKKEEIVNLPMIDKKQTTLTDMWGVGETKMPYQPVIASMVKCNSHCKSTVHTRFYEDIRNILKLITEKECKNLIAGKIDIDYFLLRYVEKLSEFDKTVCKEICNKYLKIKKGVVLNHTSFKLSALDLEMIQNIPQGGNWKCIPGDIVKKSQRLMQITRSGGRTTLYGRIDYNKPSYTITTYFNRPGNGTYVHPIHNRVLSVREAARFQTFKDDYYFYGNKKDVLNQVGNAVPPLLAYQIAEKVKQKCDCHKSIDLFCGAGGLVSGFKEAGIHSILGNDIDEAACMTLKINNPEMEILCADVTKKEVKDHIVNVAINANVDVICGGPPCQGFSMAGFRLLDDPRNQLFKEFVDIVSGVMPKVVVFENVEGILTFMNGDVYKQIHELFSSLGYFTTGKLLLTSEYAIPQKRKRVIIICTRKDLQIMPETLYPEPFTINSNEQITAREAISDLEKVPCDEDACYNKSKLLDFMKVMRNEYSTKEYLKIKGKRYCEDNLP